MTDEYSYTREAWLQGCASRIMVDVLAPAGYTRNAETATPLMDGLRVSVGWPSQRPLSRKKRAIGQCWPVDASKDHATEIFVSPYVDDPIEVAGVLVHEILHAAVGTKAKHGTAFKRACKAVGLDGKATATVPGEELAATLAMIIDVLGPYPHGSLDASVLPKQSTRLLKATCANPECESQDPLHGGYTVRITAKWATLAAPICGMCKEPLSVEWPTDGEKGGDA